MGGGRDNRATSPHLHSRKKFKGQVKSGDYVISHLPYLPPLFMFSLHVHILLSYPLQKCPWQLATIGISEWELNRALSSSDGYNSSGNYRSSLCIRSDYRECGSNYMCSTGIDSVL